MRLSWLGLPFVLFLSLVIGCGDDATTDAGVTGDGGGGVDSGIDGGVDAGPDAQLAPAPIRVATWNVENFFDERNDPERGDDVHTASEVREELQAIAAVLASLDADFVALQEVETEALLERLATGPAADLGYTEWGLMDSFDGRGIDVGFLSRVPVTNVTSHLGERFPSPDDPENEYFFSRDALEVFLNVGGHELLVIVVHFRSQLDDGDDHRYAEANYVRQIVERRLLVGQDRQLVVGDLNDERGSRTLDLILEGDALTDLTTSVPSTHQWTFVYRGARQQLDYALGTERLVGELERPFIYHGEDIAAASDHQPVWVDLTLQP